MRRAPSSIARFALVSLLGGCGGIAVFDDGAGRGDGSGEGGSASASTAASPTGMASVGAVDPGVGPAVGTATGSGGAESSSSTGCADVGVDAGVGGFEGATPQTTDSFNYAEVYLAGTLSEACGLAAIAHWSAPDAGVTGFDSLDGSTAQIRSVDARLVYANTSDYAVREFYCDACPYAGTYPDEPLANDPSLPLPPCLPSEVERPRFLLSPSGDMVHSCGAAGAWYDADGVQVYDDLGGSDPLIHLGTGALALTSGGVVDLAANTYAVFEGLPSAPIIAVRAIEGIFLVVVADEVGADQLWQVEADGIPTLMAIYPALPAGVAEVAPSSSRLDIRANLFQIGVGVEPSRDLITRREPGGASEVVYDESDDPLVRIDISALVTGP